MTADGARKTTNSRSGRPPKFREPRRPVTVTLPESTLARLASIHPDRARAIVKATDTALALHGEQKAPVELVEIAPGVAIVTVGPSRLLPTIAGVRLIEIAPLRFLVSIPLGTSSDSLELAVIELIESVENVDDWERSLLSQLRDLLRRVRRRGDISKAEILFVDTGARGVARRRK
jgi:hypothetical protein